MNHGVKQINQLFPMRLKKLRLDRRVPMSDICYHTRISQATLYRYEQGNDPKLSHVIEIAQYFKVSLEDLTGY